MNSGSCSQMTTSCKCASTNHKEENKTRNQSELETNACNQRQARENACVTKWVAIGFVTLHLIGWVGGAWLLNQSKSEVNQNQTNLGLFLTLDWKLLYNGLVCFHSFNK